MKTVKLTGLRPSTRKPVSAPADTAYGALSSSERFRAEEAVLTGADGRHRRKLGKIKQLTIRVEPSMHALIMRLADRLSEREGSPVSIARTVETGILLLEQKLAEDEEKP